MAVHNDGEAIDGLDCETKSWNIRAWCDSLVMLDVQYATFMNNAAIVSGLQQKAERWGGSLHGLVNIRSE